MSSTQPKPPILDVLMPYDKFDFWLDKERHRELTLKQIAENILSGTPVPLFGKASFSIRFGEGINSCESKKIEWDNLALVLEGQPTLGKREMQFNARIKPYDGSGRGYLMKVAAKEDGRGIMMNCEFIFEKSA